jgi:hypothetical protein
MGYPPAGRVAARPWKLKLFDVAADTPIGAEDGTSGTSGP